MADHDLDQLLDEVEQTFAQGNDASNRTSQQKTSCSTRTSIDCEIDAILKDLPNLEKDTVEEFHGPNTTFVKKRSCATAASPTHAPATADQKGSKPRCLRVVLGGGGTPTGCNQGGTLRACDALRCTSCDLPVLRLEGCSWTAGVDYLFCRNNYPDLTRLKARTTRRTGSCAYACQCSWVSVRESRECSSVGSLKWVCGGHSMTMHDATTR